MILIVSHKADGHGDAVCKELDLLQAQYIRLSLEDFPQELLVDLTFGVQVIRNSLAFNSKNIRINFDEITSVWYRRPNSPNYDPRLEGDFLALVKEETQVFTRSFWYSFDSYWMSRPEYVFYAEQKPLQLRVAEEIGWSIPPTLITNNPESAYYFYEQYERDIIVKPISRSWVDIHTDIGKQEYVIYTTPVSSYHAERLNDVKFCPTLFQQRIPKAFELRVTVVGPYVFACRIDSQNSEKTKHDWRRYDIPNTPHTAFNLPKDIKEKCIELAAKLGLNFGAIDIIVTPSGDYILCEINPNGQWYWIEHLTQMPITKTIAQVLHNRINIAEQPRWAHTVYGI